MLLACNSPQLFSATRRHPIAIAVQSVPQCRRLNQIRFSPNLRCTACNLNLNLKPSKSNNNSLAFWSPYSLKLKCTTALNLKPDYEDPPPPTPPWIWIFFLKKCEIVLVTMVASSLLWSWAASAGPIVQPSSSSPFWSCLFSRISESGIFKFGMFFFNMGVYLTVAFLSAVMGCIALIAGLACIACIACVIICIPIYLFLAIAECWQHTTKQIDAQIAASADWEKTTVLKLQVGFLGSVTSVRSLLQDLNHIAKPTAPKTTTKVDTLTKTICALRRHSKYYVSAYSSAHVTGSIEEAKNQFESLSLEERVILNAETLGDVNYILSHPHTSLKADGLNNKYTVVTILVAIQGNHMMPTIKGSEDLKNTLQKLKFITLTSQIRAVEVLWTTQTKNDTLLEKELVQRYPHLMPL